MCFQESEAPEPNNSLNQHGRNMHFQEPLQCLFDEINEQANLQSVTMRFKSPNHVRQDCCLVQPKALVPLRFFNSADGFDVLDNRAPAEIQHMGI